MRMPSSALLWRGLLLAQYAAVLFLAIAQGRVIAWQLHHGGWYPRGCFPVSLTESLVEMAVLILALAAIIGLFTRRLWPKILYGLWTLLVLYVLADSVISEWPGVWQADLFIPALAATLCGVTLGWALLPGGARASRSA